MLTLSLPLALGVLVVCCVVLGSLRVSHAVLVSFFGLTLGSTVLADPMQAALASASRVLGEVAKTFS